MLSPIYKYGEAQEFAGEVTGKGNLKFESEVTLKAILWKLGVQA